MLEVTTNISLQDQINHFIQHGQDYEGVFLVMFKALIENTLLNIPRDFRNNLVSKAFNKGQEASGIKISICNALEPSGLSLGNYHKIKFPDRIVFLNLKYFFIHLHLFRGNVKFSS